MFVSSWVSAIFIIFKIFVHVVILFYPQVFLVYHTCTFFHWCSCRQRMKTSIRSKHEIYARAAEANEKTPLLGGGKSGPVFTASHGAAPPLPVPPSAIPSLSSALTKTFGVVYLVSLGFKFLSDVLQFVSPILLG
jgi:hypothetical protein